MPTTIFLLICVGFLSFAVGSLAEYACRLEKRLERLEKHTQTDPGTISVKQTFERLKKNRGENMGLFKSKIKQIIANKNAK